VRTRLLRPPGNLLGPVSILAGGVLGLVTLLAASSVATVTLTRGPYLQRLTTTAVTVVWNTDVPAACSLAIRPLGGTAAVIPGETGTVCAIPVTGLSPGTQYAYVPHADGVPLDAESVFRTDDPRRPFSFLVVGDSGSGGAAQAAVRDRMLKTTADFVVHTGDMVYPEGAADDFDPKFFWPYRDLIRRLDFWPCLGNHDWNSTTPHGQPWRDAFYTPANNPAGSENYYSFDFGNAHFVVLNSNGNTAPGSAQYMFLDSELAASTAVWKFVVFHHTIYSSGTTHGSDLGIRTDLVPLFDAHGVDIVFMGHEHNYERTKPLRGCLSDPCAGDQIVESGAGTVYMTTGGGGKELYPLGPLSSFTAYAESVHNFTRVVVDGESLFEQMIGEDGVVRDSLTLVKGNPPPQPRCGDGLVNQPREQEQCDGADHPACAGPCAGDCTCAPICGDGVVNQATEECDGADDAACPNLCLSTCRCGDPLHFLTLAPAADTYIEAGTEAALDHGAADHLNVDSAPPSVVYLKFDLSSVTVPITRATLMLHCTNPSNDGGVLYPVDDSSWVEGTDGGAEGGSGGPGLKWVEVDTNADGHIDPSDTSPYVPDFERWVGVVPCASGQTSSVVDVTSALPRAVPDLWTLAIRNDTPDKAAYASRESTNEAERPRLRLELAGVPPTTSTTSTTTTTSTSTSTTHASTTTTMLPQPSTTTTTTASTSTTTTEPPGCDPPDCDDGNPCTVDTCEEGSRCAHAEAIGFDSVRCVFRGAGLQTSLCAREPVPVAITGRFDRAHKVVDRAAEKPRRRQAKLLLRRSMRILRSASHVAARLGKRHKLDPECVSDLRRVLDDGWGRVRLLLREL